MMRPSRLYTLLCNDFILVLQLVAYDYVEFLLQLKRAIILGSSNVLSAINWFASLRYHSDNIEASRQHFITSIWTKTIAATKTTSDLGRGLIRIRSSSTVGERKVS